MLDRILSDNSRQVLVAMIPFIWLGYLTLSYALKNQPAAVEIVGAGISIWALVNVSQGRGVFTEALAKREQQRVWNHLYYEKTVTDFRESALELTFDIHSLQIAQMSAHLGVPNPYGLTEKSEISELALSVRQRMDEREQTIAKQMYNKKRLDSSDVNNLAEISREKSWEGLLRKLEVCLGVWGAVQSAVGGLLVTRLHEHLATA